MSNSSKAEPLLADQFVADSYRVSKMWELLGNERRRVDEAMARYRADMRRAHRFVLDDEFVEYATLMQSVGPEKILTRLQYATLPYEVTWIEFDLLAKMRTLHAMRHVEGRSLEGVPQHLGLLLYRINDTDSLCTMVSEYSTQVLTGEKFIQPHLSCYFFSTVEREFVRTEFTYAGCRPFVLTEAPDDSMGDMRLTIPAEDGAVGALVGHPTNASKSCLWGYGGPKAGFLETLHDITNLRVPAFLQRHGDSGYSRLCDTIIDKRSHKLAAPINLMMQAEMAEFTGSMRFLVTMLAMLNEVPVRTAHVQPSHQQRVGLTGKRQLMDYHRVALALPKTKPVPFLERHLRGQSDRRHRAHEVRSHWRTYLHEKYCRPDEHQWEYDHDDGYRLCGKCMAFSRLIREHVRGNAELGWVRKDYVVTKS